LVLIAGVSQSLRLVAVMGIQDSDEEMNTALGASSSHEPISLTRSMSASEKAMADLSSRMVDLKGLQRPPTFSGKSEDWTEFKFRFEGIAALLVLDGVLSGCLRVSEEELAGDRLCEEDAARSHILYSLLQNLVSGRAMAILKLVPNRNGALAWRRLVAEYEPKSASRAVAQLVNILAPSFSPTLPYLESLMLWERQILEYQLLSNEILPDSVKCAVAIR
jgi:hypothetical protein